MHDALTQRAWSKVPEVTLFFWIIKIAATTLGETGGDSVTMTLGWGYLAGTALFFGLLIALVIAQILASRFRPILYWATQHPAQPWRTLPIARLASATPVGRCSC
jgi:uncharacterized membrane-anchored protein